MAKSLKILVILALVSSALPKALEPNFVGQFEDVTSNANDYNVTPEMKKSLQEIIDALKARKSDGSPEDEDLEQPNTLELNPVIENEEEEDDTVPDEPEEMCDDCEIDLEKEDEAREEFAEVIEEDIDYDDQSVTLSSELIGVICVMAILGLIGATFLVCLFVKIASCCKSI